MSSFLKIHDPAIPFGSLVLVTGVNGFIGSHIADQLLLAGYNVRGTVRDLKRNSWMTTFFAKKYGVGSFEIVQVTDMSQSGCFDEAVKECAGVVHTTSSVEMTASSPSPAIEDNIKTVMTALKSALGEPSVKRFVLTSSAWTTAAPQPNIMHNVDENTWNDKAIADAGAEGEPRSNGMSIFMAGKTQAELEVWKWVKEKQPHFTVNAVLPDTLFGSVLDPSSQGIPSTAGLVQMLFEGQGLDILSMILPQHFIDAVDNARLHVAALIAPNSSNERLFGFAEPFNWNDVLEIFRKIYPDRKFVSDMDLGRDVSTVANGRALELLNIVYGQTQWTSLEESIRGNVASFMDSKAQAGGTLVKSMSGS